MNYYRKLRAVFFQELRVMLAGSKIVTLMLLSLFFLELFGGGIRRMALDQGFTAGPWLIPCLLRAHVYSGCMTVLVVFLYSGVPLCGENQRFLLQRAGHRVWCLGQFLAILMTAVLYPMFLLLGSLLVMFPCLTFSGEWGTAYEICANTWTMVEEYKLKENVVSLEMIENYDPAIALLVSMLLLFLLCLLCGLFLFLVNGITQSSAGVIILSIWTFMSSFLNNMSDQKIFRMLRRISPEQWLNIENISPDLGSSGYLGTVVLTALAGVFLMAALSYYFVIKKKIEVEK